MKISILLLFFVISKICFSQINVPNTITFIQGNNRYISNNQNDILIIERKPFTIRYFIKRYDVKKETFYAMHVAVLDNAQDTIGLYVGQKINEIEFFMPGTGLASSENGYYESIFITNKGNHYLFYQDENDNRSQLVSSLNNFLELDWHISSAIYQEQQYSIEMLKMQSLFFVFLKDNNLNEVVDTNELKIIEVKFK